MAKNTPKNLIGRVDKIDFPEFELFDMPVKIDTGAYGSSIHCHRWEEVHTDAGDFLYFWLEPDGPTFKTKTYTTKVVKSSTGIAEERFVIQTTLVIFAEHHSIHMSLTNRSDMKFPVLLGRTLLSGNFIVDTAYTNLSFKKKSMSQPL